MRVKGGLGIIGALLVVSSARAQKVETQYDRNADFSSYKTYAWRQERLLTQLSKENQARVKHRWLVPSMHNCRRKGSRKPRARPVSMLVTVVVPWPREWPVRE